MKNERNRSDKDKIDCASIIRSDYIILNYSPIKIYMRTIFNLFALFVCL